MKSKIKVSVLLSALFFLVIACSLPGQSKGASLFTITPNQTMTALFGPTQLTNPDFATQGPIDNDDQAVQQTQDSILPSDTAVSTTIVSSETTTSTPPPPTPTLLPKRTGSYIYVPFLSHIINFDGLWDEWSASELPAKVVISGFGNWEDGDDLQAAYRMSWNYDGLYIAVKILDDTYVQNASGQDLYKGDCVEILFDTNLYGDFYTRYLSSDDHQIGISAGNPNTNGTKEAFLWYPVGKVGSLSSISISSTSGQGVYRMELGIPWNILGISPQAGQHYGFALRVSDNDDSSSDVQQSMVANISKNVLVDPTTWGEIILVK